MNEDKTYALHLDFETYSDVDIKIAGAYRYVGRKKFDWICLAWCIADGDVHLQLPVDPIHPDLSHALRDPLCLIHAYNATFERLVFLKVARQFGLSRGFHLAINRFRCIQALACYFSYPHSLDKVGEAMGLDIVKDPRGKYLINKLTKPKKWSNSTPFTRWTPALVPQDFADFYLYCMQDVRAERAIMDALPLKELPPKEQEIYEHTQLQNDRGVYIDIGLVNNVIKVQEQWSHKLQHELKEHTGGLITTGNQRNRILDYCKANGAVLPDLTADTVNNALERLELPKCVRTVLEARKFLSKTSTAKFKKIKQSISADQTIKGNLFYYGAITGRFGGRGFQIHNLPRRAETDPESLIHSFHIGLKTVETHHGSNVMELASKLIRPSIIAKEGYDLLVTDYSAIENRVLHWLAEDELTLKKFRDPTYDQYVDFASRRFAVPYDQVNHQQRFYGKTNILGLGYQMGAKTFIETAKGYGISITLEEAQDNVQLYRGLYPSVKALWYKLYRAAVLAVQTGKITHYGPIRFGVKYDRLFMKFPTGRTMCYNQPQVNMEIMPWGQEKETLSFMGVNPYSRKWQRLRITPGRLTENADQGLSRDILCIGALNAEKSGYSILASVHDELIATIPEGEGNLQEFNQLVCDMPDCLKGLPLKAEGYRGKRYRKQ